MMRFLALQTILDDQPTARSGEIGYPARLRNSPIPTVYGITGQRPRHTRQWIGRTLWHAKPGVKGVGGGEGLRRGRTFGNAAPPTAPASAGTLLNLHANTLLNLHAELLDRPPRRSPGKTPQARGNDFPHRLRRRPPRKMRPPGDPTVRPARAASGLSTMPASCAPPAASPGISVVP